MDNTKKLEKYVDGLIAKRDIQSLDILWTFSYSLPCNSAYNDTRSDMAFNLNRAFKIWLRKVCVRNLQKKYGLTSPQIDGKLNLLINFLNSVPSFLSKETFNEDRDSLREILLTKTSKIILQDTNQRLKELPNLDKKIVSFVLNYIPIQIEESIKKAELEKTDLPSSNEKYAYSPSFNVHTNQENGETEYFEIDTKEWTYIFNVLFDEELKHNQFKTKSFKKPTPILKAIRPTQYKEYKFWQLGDRLVAAGLGYWTFWLKSTGNIDLEFIIPNFIYNEVKDLKKEFPKPENFEKRIEGIIEERENRKPEKWKLEDFEDPELTSDVLEKEIEESIVAHPELLEDGLKFIESQCQTSVGRIDVLCKDKNENYVVIELKRNRSSDKVVGQIQRYISWVTKNLAEDNTVRGMIVLQEADKKIEYAVKGSKYPIEIKTFGVCPPIERNLRHCIHCGRILPKHAKVCKKCGKQVYL